MALLLVVAGACGEQLDNADDAGTVGGSGGGSGSGSGGDGTAATAGEVSSVQGGHGGSDELGGRHAGGAGGDECSGGAGSPMIYGNCATYHDVVCSWQRVSVPESSGGAGSGDTPCDQAQSLVDPSGAPLGGAGGDWPGRNACTGYDVDPKPQIYECLDRCCDVAAATIERRIGTCTIAGHCCVLLDVTDCGI